MRVTDLWIYPVKSLAGFPVDAATVEPWGLTGDRRWALVDEVGGPVTAREVHALLGLRAETVDEGTIRIIDRAGASFLVDTPIGNSPVPVGHSRQGFAAPADTDVNDWLTAAAGRPVRLVWQEDPTVRALSAARGGMPGEHLSLADAGPLLLTSTTSLDRLNEWVAAEAGEPDVDGIDPEDVSDAGEGTAGNATTVPLDVRRFRPNVVIDGAEPFAEDGWRGVRIGGVDFRTTMLCDRCVMTTIDPDTLRGGREPIRTLARHRRWERSTWFGTRLVAVSGTSELRVGDPVTRWPELLPNGG